MDFRKLWAELFDAGLVYRYTESRWHELASKGGHPYTSPVRVVKVSGQTFYEEFIQPTLVPLTLKAAEVRELENVAAAWPHLLRFQYEVARDGLAGLSGNASRWPWSAELVGTILADEERTAFDRFTGYPSVIQPFVRLDCVRTRDGFRVVDINSTRPAGVGDGWVLTTKFASQFGPTPTFKPGFNAAVAECYHEWTRSVGREGEMACVAIVVAHDAGDWHNFRLISEMMRGEPWIESVTLVESPPTEADGFNLVVRSRIKTNHPFHAALEAIDPRRVCVLSPLHRRWVGDKRWFYHLAVGAVAEAARTALGDERYELLMRVIPETGVIHGQFAELPRRREHVLNLDRKDWVLKPPKGSSGQGVIIGATASVHQWETALWRADGGLVQRGWVVREPCQVAGREIPDYMRRTDGNDGSRTQQHLYTRYGVYLYAGQLTGIEFMARPTSLVHGARNTYLSTTITGS